MKADLSLWKLMIRNLKHFRIKSLFYKIFLAVVSLVAIMGMIYFFSIQYVIKTFFEKEITYNEVYLEYSCSLIDNLFGNISDAMFSIAYDSDITTLKMLTMQTYEKYDNQAYYKEISNVAQKLGLNEVAMDELADFYVYFPKIGKVIDGDGLYNFNSFISIRYTDDPDIIKEAIIQRHSYSINNWDFNPVESRKDILSNLYLVKTLYDYNNEDINCVIVANINSAFLESLYKDNEFFNERNIYIVNEDGIVICNCISDPVDEQTILDTYRSDQSQDTQYIVENGKLLTYLKSSASNICYFILTPEKVILKDISVIRNYLTIFLLVLFLAGIIASFKISQRFYYPITSIIRDIQALPIGEHVLDRNFDEISFIQSRLSDMANSNLLLEKEVKESTPFILEVILKKLLLGKEEIGNALSLCVQFNISFKEGCYSIGIIRTVAKRTPGQDIPKEPLNIIGLCDSRLPKDNFQALKVRACEYVVVIYCKEENRKRELINRFRQFSEELHRDFKNYLFQVAVGLTQTMITEIGVSYNQALSAIGMRGVRDDQILYEYRKVQDDTVEKIYLPSDMEQRLFNYICSGNTDQALAFIGEILNRNYDNNISFSCYLSVCQSIHNVMGRIVSDWTFEMDVFKSDMNIVGIKEDIYDIPMLKEWLYADASRLCAYFLDKKNGNTFIDEIVEFVDHEYCDDINLDFIAHKFNYNSNYLSKCFKQAKGVSFTEYLSRKRIEKARLLLIRSNMPIKEVARVIGYSSSNIFIRVFEKHTGITPGRYRKQNRFTQG